MSPQIDSTAIIVGALSALTTVLVWVFRFKIAGLARGGREKAPSEVLFEGYEHLLKQYQEALDEKDGKIVKLETSFNKLQSELDSSKRIIQKMKQEDEKKQRIITELELKLAELKKIHNVSKI